jgi:hypothetical protein
MIRKSSTLIDVAFEVCTALERAGIRAVLSGGGAATFHAPDANQSGDLDFITVFGGTGGAPVLEQLGFRREGHHYAHDESDFILEFPPGPLAIGDDDVTSWDTIRRDDQILHVLTATDSCRDRLASYLFWNDFSGLEQAIAIVAAKRAEVDLDAIRAWCERERQATKYELFAKRIRTS